MAPVLTICPGLTKAYRLAAVGGATFDVIEEFDTSAEAQVARGAAVWANARLAEMFGPAPFPSALRLGRKMNQNNSSVASASPSLATEACQPSIYTKLLASVRHFLAVSDEIDARMARIWPEDGSQSPLASVGEDEAQPKSTEPNSFSSKTARA